VTERELGLARALDTAKALLKEWDVRTAADIDLPKFAAAKGVRVAICKLDGALARLKFGRKPIIRISDRPMHPGDLTFLTGHELAHLVLKHPPSRVGPLTSAAQLHTPPRSGTGRHYEAEANAVSAEWCMPSDQLVRPVSLATPSLELPHWIATTYTTTLAASAIRFAELTPKRCAAVYSKAGKIVWAVPSQTFGIELPRGTRLDPRSMAAGYHASGELDERTCTLAGDAWFATTEEVLEHSVVAPETDGVITLLWVPEPAIAPVRIAV
jgi:hypothetical protein